MNIVNRNLGSLESTCIFASGISNDVVDDVVLLLLVTIAASKALELCCRVYARDVLHLGLGIGQAST